LEFINELNCGFWQYGRLLSRTWSVARVLRVDTAFTEVDEWKAFTLYVTGVAVSLLYVASYVESTRGLFRAFANGTLSTWNMIPYKGPIFAEENGSLRCWVCWKAGTKKCAQCLEVGYCSRECQVKDWRMHKKACKPKEG
jgi:hypothetical protein